jgi:hypothetical protein
VTEDEFDTLVMDAKAAGIGDFMDKSNTPALAHRLKRMLAKGKPATEPKPQSFCNPRYAVLGK